MKFHVRRRYAVGISLALVAVIATSGAVLAYWTSTGTASSTTAVSGSAAPLTVTIAEDLTPMYPGDSAQTIHGTVTNPGPNSVRVQTVTVSITGVTASGTCSAGDFTLSNAVATVGVEVAAGGSTAWTGPTIQFYNDPAVNQDGCKGATVELTADAN